MIQTLDLVAQYQSIKLEMDAAVLGVLASGNYINGPNVTAFEEEMAVYLGVRHAVALNSGTDALYVALRSLDIGPGDEVITTPFTFIATTEAIILAGARPVFVDIDSATYAVDVAQVRAAIGPRTRAILPVHLYGAPAAIVEIKELAERNGVALIEDCAQAMGSTVDGRHVGTFGNVGCFSFFPSKNLGAFGDGGMLVTDAPEVAARARRLRSHGSRVKYYHEELGLNSRLDEMQAAILRVKLPHLDAWILARRKIAAEYNALLSDIVALPENVPGHVYHQYTIELDERDRVQNGLRKAGIGTAVYYPVPLHLQKVHDELAYLRGSFPVSERAAEHVLSLPIYPELDSRVVRSIANALTDLVLPKGLTHSA